MRDIIFKRLTLLEKEKNTNSKLWNITWEQGVFLEGLIEIKKPKNILEIGTSNGFSTLWIVRGICDCDFEVDTIDVDSNRLEEAKKNFRLCKIDDKINCYCREVFEVLPELKSKKYGFVFVDAAHKRYLELIGEFVRLDLLEEDFTIVFDNVLSHRMNDFIDKMRDKYFCEVVDVGGGFLVLKSKI